MPSDSRVPERPSETGSIPPSAAQGGPLAEYHITEKENVLVDLAMRTNNMLQPHMH